MDVADLVLEAARFLLVIGIAGALVHLGRRHELGDEPGWRWIQAGLGFFALEAAVALVDEFVLDRPLLGGVGLETLAEDPLLLAGFACLAYGLVRFLPLPAKLQEARDRLASANERLETRVEERTAELAESERRLRQITEHLDAAVWLAAADRETPQDDDLLYVSPTFEKMFGMPAESVHANPLAWMQAVHPDDVERVADVIEAIDPEDPGFEVEFRIQREEGEIRHVRTKGFPIEAGGQVVRLAGITNDVTELREVENQLRERRRQLDAVLRTAPTVLFALDPEGKITLSEGQELEHLDLDPGQAVGENVFELFGDNEQLLDMVRRALEGETVSGTTQVAGRWWETRYNPQFDEEGELERVVGVSLDVTQQTEAQREIERERDLRAALFEENIDPILELAFEDEGPVVEAVNAAFREVFGFHEKEVLGEPLAELIVPPEDRSHHEAMVERLLGGESVQAEVVRGTKTGPRRFLGHALPLSEEDRVRGAYVWYTDITKLRELEAEEAFKARLLDEVGQAVNATDEEGRIRYWNAHAEKMFGYPADEAIGGNIFGLVDAHDGHREEILTSMRAGEEWEGELRVEHEDGTTFPAVFTKEPILDDEDNFEGMIGISYDVSDLRRLEEEEAFKAELLDHVGQAVISTDAEGAVVYWNRHAEELYGYTAEEARGEPVMELTVPDTEEGRRQAEEIMSDLSAGETWTGEFTARRKDGSTFPALVSDSPVLDDEGNVVGVIGVSRNISQLKEAQRKLARITNRLRSRNRELRELSQATAHGFRTPIWDTVRFLDLLEQTAGDELPGEADEHLATAKAGAHRLHELVESLQEYLNATTREPGIGPADAGAAVDQVLMSLSEDVGASGAGVSVEEPAPELAVDEASLSEVFRQLVKNALTFRGDEPPEIEVIFEREDAMWVVSVQDNGCGIEREYHERVFRPFRTVHGQEEGAGPGLGLALCRGIVEAHGGAIWMNSAPGEGTTVHMTLPAAGHDALETFPQIGGQTPTDVEAEGFDEGTELFE